MAMEMLSPYCPPESGIVHVIGQDTYFVVLKREKILWNHVKFTNVFRVLSAITGIVKTHWTMGSVTWLTLTSVSPTL